MSKHKPSCLVVRPVATSHHAGDEIVYRKSLAYLEKHFNVEVETVLPTSKVRTILNLVRLAPPEILRWISHSNRRLVWERRAKTYDAIYFFCEVTFPSFGKSRNAKENVILVAHNVHSIVALTEGSLLGRFWVPIARSFERRWYDDPDTQLVCISQKDVVGLQRSGLRRARYFVAPPGAPPAAPFPTNFQVIREVVLTGSYGWWRKRRDLEAFVATMSNGLPIWTSDVDANAILSAASVCAQTIAPDFAAGLRFGLITDRFEGGFKLKSLEYISKNCMVASLCDISAEFQGIPHSEEFVRQIKDYSELDSLVSEFEEADAGGVGHRFGEFRAACLARYDWDNCLAPLLEAYQLAASKGQ